MKFSKWKWLLIPFLITFAVIAAGWIYFTDNLEKFVYPTLVSPEYMSLDRDKPFETQVRRIEIAGREMDIPVMYVDGRFERGKKQDDLLLLASLADLKAIPQMTRYEYKKYEEEKQRFQILLYDQSKTTDIKYRAEIALKRNLHINQFVQEIYGLKEYAPDKAETSTPWDHLFIEEENRETVSFILCSNPSKQLVNHNCSHFFYNKGLLYDLGYNKIHLAQWRELREKAINFIDNFETSESH